MLAVSRRPAAASARVALWRDPLGLPRGLALKPFANFPPCVRRMLSRFEVTA